MAEYHPYRAETKTMAQADSSTASFDIKKVCNRIQHNIDIIVSRHGIDGKEWAEAISSQYFLLSFAKIKNHDASDYESLLNKCISGLKISYQGVPTLDTDKLLITPDETKKIITAMWEEDKHDKHFANVEKMKAENIDAEQMYANFHYGLIVKIVSLEDNEYLRILRKGCLDKLFESKAVDDSDGWYPYRVPWITGRILTSLSAINLPEKEKPANYDKVKKDAIASLYRRLEKEHYWRSGVGNWVSKWESTSLCLEALFENDEIIDESVKPIIDYCCNQDSMKQWNRPDIGFDSEENGNHLLAFTMLASTLVRITKKRYQAEYDMILPKVVNFFDHIITQIKEQTATEQKAKQYCTVPEVLYYVQIAVDSIMTS